jgi:sugar phosphate isomerase/epimerase
MATTTRRRLLIGALAVSQASRKPAFRYSICNELFEKWEFAPTCRAARQLGYTGLEIAPFTLGESVEDVPAARRKELRGIMSSEGIAFAGLHWLLVTPKWLHITTADKATREKSWDYFRKLIDLCGDLGEGGVMVLGSPKQRGTRDGATRDQAVKYLTEGLAMVAAQAAARKATISLEALDHSQTDVVNTLAEAVAVVQQVNHPAIQTMFDYHNTPDEKEPHDVLVRRYYPMIRHIHINEMDGRHPGTGKYDFLPVLRVLKEKGYRGWVSLEVFDFKLGAERIAREAMEHIRKLEERL